MVEGLTGTPSITVANINSAGIGTIATLSVTDFTVPTLKGHSTIRSIHGTTTTFVVTVAAKTSAHRYNGSGSSNGYKIDGVESPFITFTPGRTYRFDVSDGTNALHPLRFYYDVDKTTAYTTGVTVSGTQGSGGAYVEIVVSDTTPTVLHYQCSSHAKMGNSVQTNSNVLDTEHNSTVRGTFTSTQLSVTSTSVFNDDVTFTGASNNIVFDKSSNQIRFNDSAMIRLGTDNDANIRHDGSNMWIQNSTGYIYMDASSKTSMHTPMHTSMDLSMDPHISASTFEILTVIFKVDTVIGRSKQ